MFTLGGHLEVDGNKEAPTPLMVFGRPNLAKRWGVMGEEM